MEIIHGTDIGIPLVHVASYSRRIGHHCFQFLTNFRLSVRQVDGVVVTFAHFATISAR